jgi:glycosyltransferase involved in cell wall biosynthesis
MIVDGGSTDGTVDIIKRHAAKHPHIRWISEKDEGQSDAMNKGIRLAQGEVIGFLNVDDYYEPNVLNDILDIFSQLPVPSFVVGNCNVLNESGEIQIVSSPRQVILKDLLIALASENHSAYPVNPVAYFYHKLLHEQIGFYRKELVCEMDLDFLCRAYSSAAKIKYVDQLFGHFRLCPGTKTFKNIQCGKDVIARQRLVRQYKKQLSFCTQIIFNGRECFCRVKPNVRLFSLYLSRLFGRFLKWVCQNER